MESVHQQETGEERQHAEAWQYFRKSTPSYKRYSKKLEGATKDTGTYIAVKEVLRTIEVNIPIDLAMSKATEDITRWINTLAESSLPIDAREYFEETIAVWRDFINWMVGRKDY